MRMRKKSWPVCICTTTLNNVSQMFSYKKDKTLAFCLNPRSINTRQSLRPKRCYILIIRWNFANLYPKVVTYAQVFSVKKHLYPLKCLTPNLLQRIPFYLRKFSTQWYLYFFKTCRNLHPYIVSMVIYNLVDTFLLTPNVLKYFFVGHFWWTSG